MQCTKVAQLVQRTQEIIFSKHPAIKSIVDALHIQNARVFFVRGVVQDALLQKHLESRDSELSDTMHNVLNIICC